MEKESTLLSEIKNEADKKAIEKIQRKMAESKPKKITTTKKEKFVRKEPTKESELKILESTNGNHVSKTLGGILVAVGILSLVICIFIWIIAGLSAANEGTTTIFPTYYLMIPLIITVIGVKVLCSK